MIKSLCEALKGYAVGNRFICL